MIVECGSTVEYLKSVFMDEISGPSPQISHCIRNHDFPRSCPIRPCLRTKAQRSTGLPSGSSLSAQKQYEQDVYNFSRTLGLSMDDAETWVLKAREFWSEERYNSTNTEEGEDVSSSSEMLDQPFREPSPAMFTVPLVSVEHSETEAAVEKDGEKAAKDTVKSARKAPQKAEKKVTRQAEKSKRKKGDGEQIANSGGQAKMTDTIEEASQFEQLEDKDKSQRQKKRGRKRKEELEVLRQSEVNFGEQHKHKKSRMESDAQDVNSRKSKTKKRHPQYSPFFQRSSLTEAEKYVNRKVNQLTDHESSGSIPEKKDVAIDEAKMLVDFSTPMI